MNNKFSVQLEKSPTHASMKHVPHTKRKGKRELYLFICFSHLKEVQIFFEKFKWQIALYDPQTSATCLVQKKKQKKT